MYFPEWSDLSKVSLTTKNSWESQSGLWEEYRRYFEGDIFKEKVEVESDIEGEPPLLFPVGLNLVKMLCLAQADTLFGEWEDQLFHFESSSEEEADDPTKEAIRLLSQIMYGSNGNSMFWEAEVMRNAYGGAAFKISPTLQAPYYMRWAKVPKEGFYPIWDPDDEDTLLETFVVVDMTNEQAKAKYNVTFDQEIVRRVEHWTPLIYENILEGRRMDAYSGTNPWGFVPFTYIPRERASGNWYGDALTADLVKPQDELNGVIADVGEAINYNSHPTRWGINLPRAFEAKNFPLGANAFWDLGRTIGSSPKPEVGVVEVKNPVPQEVFQYISFLYDWSRTSTFAPAVVFGEDANGAQRSGATVELRMWPLVKYTRRSRGYMGEGIRRMIQMTGKILKQKKFPGVSARAVERMCSGLIVPKFETILPPDHQAIVDEVIKLMTTEPKGISLETSQKILGRGTGEVERIKRMYKEWDIPTPGQALQQQAELKKAELQAKTDQATQDAKSAQAGKAQPQGESK